METITDLIKGVSVPRMVKIREVFDDTHIPVNMIADMVNAELSREALGGQVKPGMRIAITCGSRGMSNNAVMAKAIVDFVKQKVQNRILFLQWAVMVAQLLKDSFRFLKIMALQKKQWDVRLRVQWIRYRLVYLV